MNLITKTTTLLISIAVANAVSPASATGGTMVRTHQTPKNCLFIHDSTKSPSVTFVGPGQTVTGSKAPADTICDLVPRVQYGQPAPRTGGGTLETIAPYQATTMNSFGSFVFGSSVLGSSRNQGMFVSDPAGTISAAVIGCGALGGGGDTTSVCGDPSPIGGKISGLFFFTPGGPAINDTGDVLFLSDVNGGTSRRALFLYRGASGNLEKVAAVGDPSPVGGVFGAVGPGSINNSGKVVFLASRPESLVYGEIFMWDNGVITKVAAIGDPAPGGGTFLYFPGGAFGFVDGTTVPVAPVPDINDSDQISFPAVVSGGITERGIVVRSAGVNQWYVKVPDPTPIGGTYSNLYPASLNNAGQIAFFADYNPTPPTSNSGWFAGAPGNWRKVVVFNDPIDGGECHGLALSGNPEQAIDAAGNVLFWCDLNSNGGEDRMVLSLTDGTPLVAARNGDPTPIGGIFNGMSPWPTMNDKDGNFGSYTPGANNGVFNAYFNFSLCADAITLQARVKTRGTNHNVQLKWSPADGGAVSIIRNGATVGNTADDGNAKDKLGTQTGTFTYQVCETDSGDCSNEVTVTVP